MTIYQFQNMLYVDYGIISFYMHSIKSLYIKMSSNSNNPFRRAIGEEENDFLKYHKDIIIY